MIERIKDSETPGQWSGEIAIHPHPALRKFDILVLDTRYHTAEGATLKRDDVVALREALDRFLALTQRSDLRM